MKLSYEYGELEPNGMVDATKNSGNIAKQSLTFNGLTNPFVQTFKYDPLYRLTEAKEISNGNQTWRQNFGYDRYGNRTTHEKFIGTTQLMLDETVHPEIDNTTNRFVGGQGFTFDGNGNLIVDAQGRQFTFNGDNKQTLVKDDQNNEIGQYFYDGDGRRIKKVVPLTGETTIFVYSAGKLIAEYSTEAPPQTPATSYTITDHLGSPRVIVNAIGQVVSRRDFMPFGEEVEADGTYRTTAQGYGRSDSVRQRFTGYQKDDETGLDFAEARMYQSVHGRFTAIDPLLASALPGNPQSWNRYIYVGNDPLTYTDPTGMEWYYNAREDRYQWFNDGDEVADGFVAVAGTQGSDDRGVGSFVYEREGGGWVRLNPYANQFEVFADRDEALGNFQEIYQCDCQHLTHTIADESARKGMTVALVAATGVAVGTGVGAAMAATGTAAGAGVTTLGLTSTGTATTAATTTAATATTVAASQSSSVSGNAIAGFTKHGINSAISHNGVGVSTRAILNTLKEPVKIIVQSEGRLKIVGKDAVVVLNQAGKVITTWSRNSGANRVR